MRKSIPTQNIAAHDLRGYLPDDPGTTVAISYQSGELAMRSTVADVLTLGRHQCVFGVAKAGRLVSVRLSVSIHAAKRVLSSCQIGSAARQGSVSVRRTSPGAKRWVQRIDRAKLGRVGSSAQRLWTPSGTISALVPGLRGSDDQPLVTTRRVVS